jgi:RNA 2',3'-cyclic 3'-phosphodiesterase
MIRLFVALELPLPVRERLHQLGGGVPGARWQDLEKLHLTLRFIGEVPEDQAGEIVDELSGVDFPAFNLMLDSVGCFGEGKRTRLLWAGVESNPQLLALKTKVEASLSRAGCDPDRHHKFTPHITLARLHHPPADRVIQWLQACAAFRAGPISVDQFTLFSSDKKTYRVEQVFDLNPKLLQNQAGGSDVAGAEEADVDQ